MSDWTPKRRGVRGEVNLSPIKVLTLRPRVGGFYMSGRLWEVQLVVLFTLRAVPPTQLTLIRVSF